MSRKKIISIIIPVYNEEKNVWNAYSETKKVFDTDLSKYDFEIIFTDNNSTDNTMLELEKIAVEDHRVKVVTFTRNFGFNKSLITGYRLAEGDAAIQLDCDLQDPPQLFKQFVELWEQGHDVVVGRRVNRPEAKWLLLLRKAFYRFLSNISQDNVVLDGGDFRLVDRTILDQLREIHDSTPYVRGLVSILSSNQTDIPYHRDKRRFGESKFPVIKLIGLALDGIVSHSTLPLRLATITGVIVTIITILLSLFYFSSKLIFDYPMPAGFATDVILQLLSISLNAIFLGVIGEYVARIHQQLRYTPITVIKKTINFSNSSKHGHKE